MYIEVKPSIDYIGDGIQRKFTFPFDYLRKAFIKVSINDTPMDAFTVEGKEVTFDEPPALEARLNIYRETSTTRLVSWADASVLRARDMNINDVQVLHLIEEQQVWTERNAVTITEEQAYNFYNRIIANVADPVNDGDVVTLRYYNNTKTGILQEINKAKTDAIDASTVATNTINTLVSNANDRFDIHLLNMTNAKTQALTDIANAKDEGVSLVNSTKDDAMRYILEARSTVVSAINTAKTQGVGDVNNAKNEALNTIGSAKSDAISSISADKAAAATSASNALTEADRAKREADRAATEAGKVDMSNYLPLSGGNITDTLTVKGKAVERVNSSAANYIRYESGLQICWATISGDQGAVNTYTFPVKFSSTPTVIACGNMSTSTDTYSVDNSRIVTIRSTSTTQFKWQISSPSYASGTAGRYVAFGQWK